MTFLDTKFHFQPLNPFKSLKLKLYFIVRATLLKTKFFQTKKVLRPGQSKCPGAMQNKTISRNI